MANAWRVTNLARQSFDVASIRASAIAPRWGEGTSRSRIEYAPNGVRMANVDVGACVQWAYGIPFYQLSAPKSLAKERYDIVAKVDTPASVNQLRLMMRQLLETRFKVVLQHETKTLPVYELVVAKGAPKLPPAKPDYLAPASHSSDSLPQVQGWELRLREHVDD